MHAAISTHRPIMVIADADLLHQPRRIEPDDIITVVDLPPVDLLGPLHTVITDWRRLGNLTITTGNANGDRISYQCVGPNIFHNLRPGTAIRRAFTALGADSEIALRQTPLFCAATAATGLNIYSRIQLDPDGACFIRTTPTPLPATDPGDLSWLDPAIDTHARHAATLNSHDVTYTKCHPGKELEYKYNLPADTPIWTVAADAHRRIAGSAVPGMVARYRNELEVWHYDNHLYEVTGPGNNSGYLSFMATGDNTYRVKRKNFTSDAFIRDENITPNVRPDRPLDQYVRDILHLNARRLPSFRRIRYDVNVESITSGHVYGIFFDHNHLPDAPDITLVQCEIEYIKTRTLLPPDEPRILTELDDICYWIEQLLADYDIHTQRGYYSKLSFLRHAVANRPDLLSTSAATTSGQPR